MSFKLKFLFILQFLLFGASFTITSVMSVRRVFPNLCQLQSTFSIWTIRKRLSVNLEILLTQAGKIHRSKQILRFF